MKPTRSDTYVAIEILITMSIGIVFAFIDWRYSVLVAAIGAMIGCAIQAIQLQVCEHIRSETEDIKTTSQILDYCRQIELKDLQNAKRAILEDTVQYLKELADQKIFNERFYAWVFQQVDESKKSIKAVSAMQEDQWCSLQREISYYSHNKMAVDRGVKVTRVFLSTNERLQKKENRKPIILHVLHGLDARIVFKPQVQSMAGNEIIVNGITIFDDTILYQDVVLPSGDSSSTAGGQIIDNLSDVQRAIDKYEALLRLSESPINVINRMHGVSIANEMIEVLNESYGTFENLRDVLKMPGYDKETDRSAYEYWEKIINGNFR